MRVSMKMKRSLRAFCLAILMISVLALPALASTSIQDQMSANSDAWHIANQAGDTETMKALEEANKQLASQLAGSNGSASFDSTTGSWEITDSSGNTTTSSSTGSGKDLEVSYTTVTQDGSVSTSTSGGVYSQGSIESYYEYGGTDEGLVDAYNKDAADATTTGNYGGSSQTLSAADEANVAQAVLGLTNEEAAQLQADLEASKQDFINAQADYEAAVAAGDSAAAAAAQQRMDEAHAEAEEIRAGYGYTGDSVDASDGGYIYDHETDTWVSNGDGGGFNWWYTYTITSSAGEGGTISPHGKTRVDAGNNLTYTITPYNGYVIKHLIVDDLTLLPAESFVFKNINKDHTITAVFERKGNIITATAGEGGSISPEGSTSVPYGNDKTYTITPDEGYVIKSVIVDIVNKGGIHTYTFEDVTTSHTITATFEKKVFNIVSSAGEGGSISPNGTTSVPYGNSKTYTITPSFGYVVDQVIVDGVNQGALSTYTFANVKAAHTISATFKPAGKVDLIDTDIIDADGNSIDIHTGGRAIKSGYGFFANVRASHSNVTDVKVVMTYNFGFGTKSVVLEEAASGRFVFPVNLESPLNKRCVYIPVATQGTGAEPKDYTLTLTITGVNSAGETVTDTATAVIRVNGNMYEDDFTGDS